MEGLGSPEAIYFPLFPSLPPLFSHLPAPPFLNPFNPRHFLPSPSCVQHSRKHTCSLMTWAYPAGAPPTFYPHPRTGPGRLLAPPHRVYSGEASGSDRAPNSGFFSPPSQGNQDCAVVEPGPWLSPIPAVWLQKH